MSGNLRSSSVKTYSSYIAEQTSWVIWADKMIEVYGKSHILTGQYMETQVRTNARIKYVKMYKLLAGHADNTVIEDFVRKEAEEAGQAALREYQLKSNEGEPNAKVD